MQAMLAPLHQGMSQGDVIREKGSRGLLDFVMGSAFGKGSLVTFIILPCTHSIMVQQCVFHVWLLPTRSQHLLVHAAQVQWSFCWCCCC